jgi:hypothetical protein
MATDIEDMRAARHRALLTSTLSRPIRTVRNSPGAASSAERTAQNRIDSKIFSCSTAKISSSV